MIAEITLLAERAVPAERHHMSQPLLIRKRRVEKSL
jgi:hypothetical protein